MRKFLIASILIVIVIISAASFYTSKYSNTKDAVLAQLEEGFRFCEVEKSNVFSEPNKFWLTCNGRPFYAEYTDGNVDYELNGWSFLEKDADLWSELENCDFYDSRDSELIFYCPYNLRSDPLAKYYKFDESSFGLTKLKEEKFEDVVSNDIKEIYTFLSDCTLSSFSGGGGRGYTPFADIVFDCEDYNYVVKTDFGFLIPPILTNAEIENTQRAKLAFEKSFGVTPTISDSPATNTTIASYQFDSCELSIDYPLEDLNQISIEIKPNSWDNESVKNVITEVGKYLLFPAIDTGEVEFISEDTTGAYEKMYYDVGGTVVEIIKLVDDNLIMLRIGERYYENK